MDKFQLCARKKQRKQQQSGQVRRINAEESPNEKRPPFLSLPVETSVNAKTADEKKDRHPEGPQDNRGEEHVRDLPMVITKPGSPLR